MTPHDRRIEIEYRTEERLGILLQGAPASLRQQFDAKQAAIAEVDALSAQPDLSSLKGRLETIYGRRRWEYGEDCLLLDIVRNPDAATQCETILAFFNRLPAPQKAYFPQSAYMLLSRWSEIHDRAVFSTRFESKPEASPTAQKKAIAELMASHPCNPDSTAYDEHAGQEQRAQWRALKLRLLNINLQIAGLK